MTDNNLFHVMKDSQRVVIFSMDREGNRTVYCPGPRSVEDAWSRYSVVKPYLDVWFDLHVGEVVSSPFAEFQPGAADYPCGLASALTYDSLLALWAYATTPDILVSLSQIARAIGIRRGEARKQLEKAGVTLDGDGQDKYRSFKINDVRRAFGREVADRIVLYSGQIADFLGASTSSVPNIVERLGIGIPGRTQVGVPWGTLRRVRRTGPRSFEVRDA
jgi:hypothetical protein